MYVDLQDNKKGRLRSYVGLGLKVVLASHENFVRDYSVAQQRPLPGLFLFETFETRCLFLFEMFESLFETRFVESNKV